MALYLYAWPLLGLSGYQWLIYLLHKSSCSFSANTSALASSRLPRATARRLRKSAPAFTSLFMVSAETQDNMSSKSSLCHCNYTTCITFLVGALFAAITTLPAADTSPGPLIFITSRDLCALCVNASAWHFRALAAALC